MVIMEIVCEVDDTASGSCLYWSSVSGEVLKFLTET